MVQQARDFLADLFSSANTPIFRQRLRPGEGLVSNNVLHNRSGFSDSDVKGEKRLLIRARFYDRIAREPQ